MTAPAKTLTSMALPLVISFTLRFLFTLVDMAYAGAIGRDAVAAIGFYLPFQGVYIAIWVGLSAGFTAALSVAFGSRDEGRIRALRGGMARFLLVLIPAISVLGASLWWLAPAFGLEPGLTDAFRIYATTLLVGMPITGFWSIIPDSVIKAHQDTRSTMMAGLYASFTNIALNTLFVFGFGLGVFGLALATVISRVPALLYAMHRARVLEAGRDADPTWQAATSKPVESWPRPMPTILRLGVPATLTYALTAGEGAVVNGLLKGLPDSTAAIATYGVYHYLLLFALMPVTASSVAVLPYIARTAAEGKFEAIRRDLRVTLTWVAGIGLALTLPAAWIWSEPLASYFLERRADDAAGGAPIPLDRTVAALRLLPLAVLASTPFLLLRPVFEGLQRPRQGAILSIARFVVFSLPLLLGARWAALQCGATPLVGILVAIVAASALASFLATRWAREALLAKPTPA